MSAHNRVEAGKEFEIEICEKNGWERVESGKPKLKWPGEGKSNFDKIKSIGCDPSKFVPILEESVFDKYDAIDKDGNHIEIKKYLTRSCRTWRMLSEPIFKVANEGQLDKVKNAFNCDTIEESNIKYNEFLNGVMENIGDDIISRMTNTFIGIQLKDSFIPKKDLEFQWKVKKSWRGYNRLTLMFRIKP